MPARTPQKIDEPSRIAVDRDFPMEVSVIDAKSNADH